MPWVRSSPFYRFLAMLSGWASVFSYHTIHPFKLCHSMGSGLLTVLGNYHYSPF